MSQETKPSTSTTASEEEPTKISIDLKTECPKLQDRYNQCFLQWFNNQFLKGNLQNNEICAEEFEDYKACMLLSLKNKQLEYLLDRDFVKEAEQESWSFQQPKK